MAEERLWLTTVLRLQCRSDFAGARVSGKYPEIGARSRIRTNDLLITNQLLCQLSYAGFAYCVVYFTTSGGVWPALSSRPPPDRV